MEADKMKDEYQTTVNTELRKTKSPLKRTLTGLAALAFIGCAGLERSCYSCSAENFATDWLVVQYKIDGNPINCWQLKDTSIANEQNSDGIYWLDDSSKNLVHISGWYNRVQVENGRWKEAAESIGIDLEGCVGGKYNPK